VKWASGILLILASLLALGAFYAITLHQEGNAPVKVGHWLIADTAQVAFWAALFSGFVMGKVFA